MSFDFNFNSNFTVRIILVSKFCYSSMIISIVISIMEFQFTDDFTSHDLILQIHQHTQKHVNVQHRVLLRLL